LSGFARIPNHYPDRLQHNFSLASLRRISTQGGADPRRRVDETGAGRCDPIVRQQIHGCIPNLQMVYQGSVIRRVAFYREPDERRMGELVRQGQVDGTIAKLGDGDFERADRHNGPRCRRGGPIDCFPESNQTRSDHCRLAEATPDDFDAAIEEARTREPEPCQRRAHPDCPAGRLRGSWAMWV
jgi:hypothetical protein